jgi:hypothetical protein
VARENVTTLDTIRGLKHRDPFSPFTIIMTSGDRYLIEDPDAMAIGGSQLFYYLPRTSKFLHLRLNQIAAVEGDGERPVAA